MAKRLRRWQREALGCYRAKLSDGSRSMLWEATPGAGKTSAALIVAADQLKAAPKRKLFVVVPTAHLKIQWARSAADVGIRLDPAFRRTSLGLARDFHGAVVTYQQIAQNSSAFRRLIRECPVVLDEIHHAGDGLSWGAALRDALTEAAFTLCLSGTAFRSDNNAIPFVAYDEVGASVPDYVYSYSRAIEEGVCRPIAFFGYGGDIAWGDTNNVLQANFTDELDRMNASRRLRAALDPESGWIGPMLRDANDMLTKVRGSHPEAGALLVAADQDHARALAFELKKHCGVSPTIVLSDDAASSKKIKTFSASRDPWLVACNMVSEGVDIPRLRVGVYATATRTRMYFRQFLGRIVRRTPSPVGAQIAYCYHPADPALQWLARDVEKEQRHLLRKIDPEAEDFRADRDENREALPPSWRPMHATNSGVESIIVNGNQLALFADASQARQTQEYHAVVEQEIHTRLDEAPTHSELRERVGRSIKELVALYHRKSRQPYAMIHMTLNRQQRVKSQLQCTYAQLEERRALLKRMLSEA